MRDILTRLAAIQPDAENFAISLNLSTVQEGRPGALECTKLLRCVPHKRIACLGLWRGRQVFAKIFFDPHRAEVHATREQVGVRALMASGLRTPALLFDGTAELDSVRVLLFEYLSNASAGQEYWETTSEVGKRQFMLTLVNLVADHHQAGIMQRDLHLDNFLITADTIYTLDGADVAVSQRKIDKVKGLENLGLLLAQVEPRYDGWIDQMLERYLTSRGMPVATRVEKAALAKAVLGLRRYRKTVVLKKIFRQCSDFVCSKSWKKFVVYDRTLASPEFLAMISDPDTCMASGEFLKRGNTSTVARVCVDGRELIIKRYNIKNWRHGLNRAFRVSRAAISWRNGYRLRFYGIGSPKPVALVENRLGPIRRKAYFITKSFEGSDCLQYFSRHDGDDAQQMGQVIVESLRRLKDCKISHGDMKGSNILVDSSQVVFIDLDAMREHSWKFRADRRIARDHRRFMRNWSADSKVHEMFVGLLATARKKPC